MLVFINDSTAAFRNYWALKAPQKIYSYLFDDFDSDRDTDLAFVSTDSDFVYLENTFIADCENESANFGYTYSITGNVIQFTTKHKEAKLTVWNDLVTNETVLGNNFLVTLIPNDTLRFKLTYQFGAGCIDTIITAIATNTLLTLTGINPDFENEMEIFPIPVSDYLNIKNKSQGTLLISDIMGNPKLSLSHAFTNEQTKIYVGDWASGIYIYNFTSKKSNKVGKLIIE